MIFKHKQKLTGVIILSINRTNPPTALTILAALLPSVPAVLSPFALLALVKLLPSVTLPVLLV